MKSNRKIKTKVTYGIVGALLLISIAVYLFFHKTHLDFELVARFRNPNELFRSQAYVFFHSSDEYESYFERTTYTRDMESHFPIASDLDFEAYSYAIFFGKPVRDMYYSPQANYFVDPSPSYASARHYGKKFVVVSYQEAVPMEENGVFLYRVPKNNKLRGVDGL